MKEDLCIFTYREKLKLNAFSGVKKKKTSKCYVEYKESLAVAEAYMQQCHSDRLGHFPLFPERVLAFRQKADLKGSS